MKYLVLRSFSATFGTQSLTASEGEIVELEADNAALLGALVQPVAKTAAETRETAVSKPAKKRETR